MVQYRLWRSFYSRQNNFTVTVQRNLANVKNTYSGTLILIMCVLLVFCLCFFLSNQLLSFRDLCYRGKNWYTMGEFFRGRGGAVESSFWSFFPRCLGCLVWQSFTVYMSTFHTTYLTLWWLNSRIIYSTIACQESGRLVTMVTNGCGGFLKIQQKDNRIFCLPSNYSRTSFKDSVNADPPPYIQTTVFWWQLI